MNPQDPNYTSGQGYTPPPTNQVPQYNQSGGYDVVPPISPMNGPGNNGHNPYEFILNPATSNPKKSSTFAKRLLVVLSGLVVLAVTAGVMINLLTPKDTAIENMLSLAQEQQEIIRVTTLVTSRAQSQDLKNLAINTQLSVGTNQQQVIDYLSLRGQKTDVKILALKQDPSTDKILTDAAASNTYDTSAATQINTLLVAYKASLQSAYNATKSTKARETLQKSYKSADILFTQSTALQPKT